MWLWVLAAVLLGATTLMQRPGPPDAQAVQKRAQGLGTIVAPQGDVLILLGKLILAFREVSPVNGQMLQVQADAMTGFAPSGLGSTRPPDPAKFSAVERVRSTILAGETLAPGKMSERLDEVFKELAEDSVLREDVQTLRALYGPEGGAEAAKTIDPAALGRLEERHGWFAKVAMSRGDKDSAFRAKAIAGGWAIIVVMGLAMTLVGVAGLTGLVMLGLAVVALFTGKMVWRFQRPDRRREWPAETGDEGMTAPKSVWLETVVVFLGGFLGLKLVAMGVHAAFPTVSETALTWGTLVGQWMLLPTIFWPVLRGMTWDRYTREIGWHRGEGVLKEIGWGVLGYCAGLPIYFGMAMIVVFVMIVVSAMTGSEGMVPDSNKVVDIVEGGSPLMLGVVYLLATVWAPIVEESIFRGALFRHLRRRWPMVVAALGSCMVFAVLHGYMVAQLFIVGTLGFWFALMREWRGTLIPGAVGHFIHNAFVLGLIIVIMSLASG